MDLAQRHVLVLDVLEDLVHKSAVEGGVRKREKGSVEMGERRVFEVSGVGLDDARSLDVHAVDGRGPGVEQFDV